MTFLGKMPPLGQRDDARWSSRLPMQRTVGRVRPGGGCLASGICRAGIGGLK